MANNDDLNSLVSGLKIDGIPNVGELEQISAYLKKKGLTSDKEKVDYLRRIDPVSIDNSLKKLGVTPDNLAVVIQEFEKFLDIMKKTSESVQKMFQSIAGIQGSFNIINKMLPASLVQSGFSAIAQNLLTPQLAPVFSDLLSKLATSQIDWSKMTVPVINLDWSKIPAPVIDSGTFPDPSKFLPKIFEDVTEKPVKAITEDTELKDTELKLYEEKVELTNDVFKHFVSFLDAQQNLDQQNTEAIQQNTEATTALARSVSAIVSRINTPGISEEERAYWQWTIFINIMLLILAVFH